MFEVIGNSNEVVVTRSGTNENIEVFYSEALRGKRMANFSIVVDDIADGLHDNVALQLVNFTHVTINTFAVNSSVEQFGNGNLADAKVVAAFLRHAFRHSIAVFEILDTSASINGVLP